MGRRPPYLAILLVSAAAVAYEILLTRLFSIIQWHHFAYMIISVALLGYGISGTVLGASGYRSRHRARALLPGAAALFGAAAVLCFLLAQALPFNALELLWEPRQSAWLLLLYAVLLAPFLAAAGCICLAFLAWPEHVSRIYAADLLGAGLGAAGLVAVLFYLPPERALTWIGAVGLGAAAVGCLELRLGRGWTVSCALLAALFALVPVELKVSPYKPLAQALEVAGAEVMDRRSSPLGSLVSVASPQVPFRHAPGLSLNAPTVPPAQLAVFTDADAPGMITRFDGDARSLTWLDYMSAALPYHLTEQPAVLVLGAGGGMEILQALHQGARRIDAVELNPQIVTVTEEVFGDFSGSPYGQPQVVTHIAEARGFVAREREHYDLIQVALLDSFNASAAGLYALAESHLYTVEAVAGFLARLRPNGLLSMTRWLKLPPRDGIKLFATAVEALQRAGIEDPGGHLALIRSWNTSTLVVSKSPLSASQIAALEAFCAERWFDSAWYPGISSETVNRFNQMQEPWLYRAATRILAGEGEAFFDAYKFNVRPATDDRPHFFSFQKLSTIPEFLALKSRGGLPLLEQGYLVLAATLIQVVVVSFLLVFVPLWAMRRRSSAPQFPGSGPMSYFFAVGLAFMMIEIAYIQKFVLLLSHPLYAVTVVLSTFLVCAGLGSMAAGHWQRQMAGDRIIRAATCGIAFLTIAYLVSLPALFDVLIPLPDSLRIACSVAMIAPLAFFMGMPFPLGLGLIDAGAIPWAWAVNGAASVIAAVGATLLAVHFGFTVVVLSAAVFYLLAARMAGTMAGSRSVRGLRRRDRLP